MDERGDHVERHCTIPLHDTGDRRPDLTGRLEVNARAEIQSWLIDRRGDQDRAVNTDPIGRRHGWLVTADHGPGLDRSQELAIAEVDGAVPAGGPRSDVERKSRDEPLGPARFRRDRRRDTDRRSASVPIGQLAYDELHDRTIHTGRHGSLGERRFYRRQPIYRLKRVTGLDRYEGLERRRRRRDLNPVALHGLDGISTSVITQEGLR